MNVEEVCAYCASLPQVTQCFPFDDETLVFKVQNKMFAFVSLGGCKSCFNLKCEPQLAIELRELYDEVVPGYHCNKKHWNTVSIASSLPTALWQFWVRHSYNEVIKKLPRKAQIPLLKE